MFKPKQIHKNWHIVDSEGCTVYNNDYYGNDKPLSFRDLDLALEVCEHLNENQKAIDKNIFGEDNS